MIRIIENDCQRLSRRFKMQAEVWNCLRTDIEDLCTADTDIIKYLDIVSDAYERLGLWLSKQNIKNKY